MGSGRNAIYLAKRGFEVEGVDISEDAVNTALQMARKIRSLSGRKWSIWRKIIRLNQILMIILSALTIFSDL